MDDKVIKLCFSTHCLVGNLPSRVSFIFMWFKSCGFRMPAEGNSDGSRRFPIIVLAEFQIFYFGFLTMPKSDCTQPRCFQRYDLPSTRKPESDMEQQWCVQIEEDTEWSLPHKGSGAGPALQQKTGRLEKFAPWLSYLAIEFFLEVSKR